MADRENLKTIDTLVRDIYQLLETGAEVPDAMVHRFADNLARLVSERLSQKDQQPSLRMSLLGTECWRKLWYALNRPELGEKLDGKTRLKFLYGDLVEALTLFLAEVSGHSVEGQQTTLEIDGVPGHRDAIVDGVLSDVKSASAFGFKKFQDHGLEGEDPFGYLDQINAYLFASQDDPALKDKENVAFIAVDKVLGGLVVDKYKRNGKDYHVLVAEIRKMLVQPYPPSRAFADEADGYWKGRGADRVFIPNGNRILGLQCSYCAFKQECWPGLKVYGGAKPKFYTHIEKEPRIEEGSF